MKSLFSPAAAGVLIALTWAVTPLQAAPDPQADADWKALSSSGKRPAQGRNESSTSYFLRTVELSDLRRRALGLKFWNTYPDDTRRYKWLLLTVSMPPRYAKDIEKWAAQESSLEGGAYAVDARAQQRWDQAYPAMRQAFWKADAVTDQERRFFWHNELEQTIARMAASSGRATPAAVEDVMEDIRQFTSAYTSAYGELDNDLWIVSSAAINRLFDSASKLGLEENTLAAFVESLKRTGNAIAIATGNRRLHQLRYPNQREKSVQLPDGSHATQWVHAPPPPASEALKRWLSNRLQEYDFDYAGYQVPEAITVYLHHKTIANRLYRDIGLQVWNQWPDLEQKVTWMFNTQVNNPVYYYLDFVDAINLGFNRGDEAQIDPAAAQAWQQHYEQLKAAILGDPGLTQRAQATLDHIEVWRTVTDTANLWARQRDPKTVADLMRHIHDLNNQGKTGMVYLYARDLLQSPDRFGLTGADLEKLIAPMLTSENESLRAFAQARRRLFDLRKTVVNFQAPTLGGEPFDLASLRGKYVLVDYWSTTCSSCIAAMPRIKEVYDRYRAHGFEVVSVCFDGQKQRRKVERAEREMGITWTTLAPPEGGFKYFADTYGFEGVPQYMLLDKEGRLIADTAEVDMGRNLERLLKQAMDAG